MANRFDFSGGTTVAPQRTRFDFSGGAQPSQGADKYDFGGSLDARQRTEKRTNLRRPPFEGAIRGGARFFDNMLRGMTLGATPAPAPAPAQTTGERITDVAGTLAGGIAAVAGAKATGGALAVRGLRGLAPKAGRLAANIAEGAGIGATLAAGEGAVQGRPLEEIGQRAAKAAVIGAATDAGVGLALGRVGRLLARKAPGPTAVPQTVADAVPPRTRTTSQPVRKADIVSHISKQLDIPVRVGRYQAQLKHGPVAGIYKIQPEVIRTKLAEDLPTIAHEVGHHLDKLYGLKNPAFDNELLALGRATSLPSYTKARVRAEGVAEHVRLYLTDPAQARNMAPSYHATFEAKLPPDVTDILHQAQQNIRNWFDQPAKARILGSISAGERQPRKMTLDRLYAATVDELHPLKRAVEGITGGKAAAVDKDPFQLAQLFRGWTGKAQTMLRHGIVDENYNKIGKSFDEIVRPISTQLDDFRAYIVARRANELHGRKIATGIAQADVDETLRTLHKPKFDTAFRDIVQYQNSVLDQLIDTGVLSRNAANAMRAANADFVPFYRLVESGGKGMSKGGFANLASPVRRIHGAEATLIDPLESIIKNTYVITNIAERNRVGKALVELAERHHGAGAWVEKVKAPMQATTFELGEVKKQMRSAGIDLSGVDLDQVATIFRPRAHLDGKDNIVTVFRNGNTEFYQLEPELYRAMLSLDLESSGMLINLLSYPARMLRAGATLTPEFMVRNPIRDQFTAYINSKYGFKPVVDTLRGLFSAIRKDDLYWKWQASGGAHGALVSLDRDYLQGSLRDLLKRSMADKTLNIVTRPIDTLRALSEFTEQATRLGEFRQGLKHEGLTGAGIKKAALASRDVSLDFARVGTATRDVNRIVAFFNAQVQGMDKMARVWRENPGRSTLRAMTSITLPSVILYSVNRNDPRYQELPQWQKDMFWIIPTAERLYRIPKPFELGMLFGSVPERVLQWIDTEDPRALDGLTSRLLAGLTPTVLPTALVPVIESYANVSLFTGSPIVPHREQDLLARYQYGPETPHIAKKIGQALDVSPRHVQNVVRGYTGGLGRYAMDAADWGLEAVGAVDPVPSPAKDEAHRPLIRAFVAPTFGPGAASIERLYSDMDGLSRRKASGHILTPAENTQLSHMESAAQKLTWYREQLRRIQADPHMSPNVKAESIEYINLQMINTARQAQGMPAIVR